MAFAQRTGTRSRTGVAVQTAAVRCAIYTRKSTDEGLDRDFNSLDNQREAAESFIASQRGEGWTPLPDRYDDGGFSGATMERPALKRLLADVEAKRLDCVVIYKLDRLSRCVRDYLNLLAFLDEHDVAFVSVTQQFNTTTPVGRMTLRMLLSFAEFERDIIAERTRDKMRASRRRGKWTGGMPPLGFDTAPEGGRLVVNIDEAEQVNAIFTLFTELRSIVATAAELNRRGGRRKSWTTKDGRARTGKPWDRVTVHRLLTDPVYVGMQKLGDDVFQGEHPAILSKALFQSVQRILDEKRSGGGSESRNRFGGLLRGILRCAACGTSMGHAPTTKNGRVYRFYRCLNRVRRGPDACPTKAISADKVEAFVVNEIKRIGTDPELQRETFRQALAQVAAQRRGVAVERKRLDRELATAKQDAERLVATLSWTTGPAGEAVRAELEKAQERVRVVEARLHEVQDPPPAVTEAEVARALEAFTPVWGVLLTPERERVLRLLVAGIRYDGTTGKLEITWRLGGFGELAEEVGGA